LLLEKRDKLEALTQRLLEKEVLDKKEIEEILGSKPLLEVNGNGQNGSSKLSAVPTNELVDTDTTNKNP
jgi:hypothetical protein